MHRIIQGDVLGTFRKLPDSFAHGLFCDPPYGIAYMGKEWDRMPSVDVWREALRNHHPTLKPIACSRHWASLIRPNVPDATLLVPFCGAGSEIIGALLAGWPRVLGIEGSSEYIEIAEERVKAWVKA